MDNQFEVVRGSSGGWFVKKEYWGNSIYPRSLGSIPRIPNMVDDQPVDGLGDGAYYFGSDNCLFTEYKSRHEWSGVENDIISRVIISDGIKRIGSLAFKNCVNLSRVDLPKGLETIEDGAFEGCAKLSDIELSEGLKYIGSDAFNGCKSLKMISIPETVEEIGAYSFTDTGLGTIVIPGSVKTIEKHAFANINHSTIILSEGVREIQELAFENSKYLTIVFPKSLAKIDPECFFEYLNLGLNPFAPPPNLNVTIYCYPGSLGFVFADKNEEYGIKRKNASLFDAE